MYDPNLNVMQKFGNIFVVSFKINDIYSKLSGL